jgi:predicted RNase H-like HicB family nuclease
MEYKTHYIFPAIFDYEDYEKSGGIHVEFSDFHDYVTSGEDKLEAMEMARERLANEINEYKQEGKSIPEPTPLLQLKLKQYQAVAMIEVYMPPSAQEKRLPIIR